MQIRCTYCQTMFAISREEMLAGLEHMEENKQIYYDAHCPNCRRANRVERVRMERAFPDWKDAIKTMSKESAKLEAAVEKPAAGSGAVKAAEAPKGSNKHENKHTPKANAVTAATTKSGVKAPSSKGKTAGTKKK